jgi:hypothetical protein
MLTQIAHLYRGGISMIEVGIASRGESKYLEISSFAKEVYLKEFGAQTNPLPNLFAYAILEDQIVGCLGLYRAQENTPLLFETYMMNAYERLSGDPNPDRSKLAELGTRVVQLPSATARSADVSVALTAVLISAAHQLGIRCVGFTTTRLVKRVTDALGFNLVILGKPDLSGKDAQFQQNWQRFFRVPQICAGFLISSIEGCRVAITQLEDRGILVRDRHK